MPSTSALSNALLSRSTSRCSAAEPGGGAGSRRGDDCWWRSSAARARLSALVTDSSVVSRMSAASRAWNPSTSRRTMAARWRGGSSCRAVMSASDIDSIVSYRASGPGAAGGTADPAPVHGCGTLAALHGCRAQRCGPRRCRAALRVAGGLDPDRVHCLLHQHLSCLPVEGFELRVPLLQLGQEVSALLLLQCTKLNIGHHIAPRTFGAFGEQRPAEQMPGTRCVRRPQLFVHVWAAHGDCEQAGGVVELGRRRAGNAQQPGELSPRDLDVAA